MQEHIVLVNLWSMCARNNSRLLCKFTHCAECLSANTRPHQLRWGDWEMKAAISCKKCSQSGPCPCNGRTISKVVSLCSCPSCFQKLLLRVIMCEYLWLYSYYGYSFSIKHTCNIFTTHKRQRWLKEALESISKAPSETDLLKAALAVLKVDATPFGF